jgi:mannopine transport system substrate-binding protein
MYSKVSLASYAAAVNGFSNFMRDAPRREMVIATTGGIFEQQMRECFFDPFTSMTGIRVRTVAGSDPQNFARVRSMVETGDITIDLYQASDIQSSSDAYLLVNEDVSDFAADYENDADFLPHAFRPAGILSTYGTTLLVFNTRHVSGQGPRDWSDFWNVRKFPGPRALPDFDDPWRVLAAALLADGVSPDRLWPLDVDRAFRKLDEIRPHVSLWWRMGHESVAGFCDETYVMGLIWQSRAAALRRDGQPLSWTQNQAFLVADRWALVRGSPNKDNALWFLEFFLANRAGQTRRSELATCTPVRHSAARQVSDEVRAMLPTSEGVLRQLIVPDATWINANQLPLLRRWQAWRCMPH